MITESDGQCAREMKNNHTDILSSQCVIVWKLCDFPNDRQQKSVLRYGNGNDNEKTDTKHITKE